jgi:gliding motility-associated-like protein
MPYTISKKYFVLFCFLLSLNLAKAQLGKEAWHWQFGDSCSLDFSSGTPIAGKSSINTKEGCASISDPNTGQLLFYTDGTRAWDRNNNQMPNGVGMIGGQGTSTQAALIVPQPGSSTIYYLISADQGGYQGANTGVHYSIVDMSLNGGLGDVTTKNTLLTPPPTTEKLTAVRHCNGVDYWIIDHPFNSNAFNVYLLTASGINSTPVVSNVGTTQSNISGTYQETIGYLKASPNGKRLACAIYYMNFFELFDFDNSTGIITNPIKISSSESFYGIAFSPNNSILYATIALGAIFQYDISSNNAANIMASMVILPDSVYNIGTLQLAPDGKIYVCSTYLSSSLSVINNPNNLGLACNFQQYGFTLSPGSKSELGLPNFIDANNPFLSQSYNTSLCNFPSYTINAANGNTNYQWLNGDTTSSISINTYGNYWVSYFTPQSCKEIDTFHVTQAQASVITILHDTSQCNNLTTPITLNATDTNVVSYLWNDGFTSPIRTITSPGNYWINYTLNNFCVSRDSFSYSINNIPLVNLGNDTTFCLGDLPLNAFNPSSSYIWNTGQTSSEITATSPNIYWVKVTNQYSCINSDTLVVHPELSAFNFVLPNIVTPNNDGINDFIDFSKYQFSSLQLEIYNRWGLKVFESDNPSCIWKPTEDDGTYYYVIQYIINCGIEKQNKILKGFITIIR